MFETSPEGGIRTLSFALSGHRGSEGFARGRYYEILTRETTMKRVSARIAIIAVCGLLSSIDTEKNP